jgi:hypothetical protein
VHSGCDQEHAGRIVKGKCVGQTARNRSHKACARTVPRGSLSFTAGAGQQATAKLTFTIAT